MEPDNEEAPQGDLRSELEAAFDGGKQPEPPVEALEETPAEAEERLYRREGRRFVAKDAAEAAADGEPKEQPAPKSWKPLWWKQEHGDWDKSPEQFRKALEQREKEFAQGVEKHATAAKQWEPVSQKLAPYMQQLAASGVSPQQYVSNLVDADAYLRQDPVKALDWLIQSYVGQGWNIQNLAQYLNEQQYQPQQRDPLQEEVQALKQQLSQLREAPVQQERARVAAEIENWSKDKPHFADVRTLMSQLSRSPEYQGATLDQLYEAAMMAHPQLRQRILEDQRKAEIQRARTAAAVSPRASSPTGQARTKPTMSLRDEIASLIDGGTV